MFKLSRILFLKDLDFTLQDIHDYLNQNDPDVLIEMLGHKHKELDNKIQHLMNLKHKVNGKIELLEHAKTQQFKINIQEFKPRYGTFMNSNNLLDEKALHESFHSSENFLKLSDWLVEGQIYQAVMKDHLIKRNFDQIQYFVEVEPIDYDLIKTLSILPEGLYACMTVIGKKDDRAKHYNYMMEWLNLHDYSIIGDAIENNLLTSYYCEDNDELMTEIQIPIKKDIEVNIK
jgi:effector-binding domain-containing protein